MTTPNLRGSTWSKWDLHVHTPASIHHNYPGDTDAAWAAFLDDLEKLPEDFKVLGINDYIFVDGYERVRNEKKKNGRLKNIDLILPVIELRLDKFGGVVRKSGDGTDKNTGMSRVNLHVIFDELEPEVIRQQFIGGLIGNGYSLIPEAKGFQWNAVITRDSLRQLGQMVIESVPPEQRKNFDSAEREGFNNLCVSLERIEQALSRHELAERHLLAIGKTEWENLKWNDNTIAEKKSLINSVDLVFTAANNPEAYDAGRAKLKSEGVKATLLDCSDAHSLSTSTVKDRIGHCFSWIKAEPTFDDLRQAITEFDQRVFVGDKPDKLHIVDRNRTKYASAMRIRKKPGINHPDQWFNVDIPLNHDLVAIIGNKGSGKSALSDAIALAGDTKNSKAFSFLKPTRFRDPKNNLSTHYEATLTWHDGAQEKRGLEEDPDSVSVERVKYLPQSYLEELCNELSGSGSSTFDGELRKIIFTHVPDDQRIGCESLDELLQFKVSELEADRAKGQESLSRTNVEITRLESRLAPKFRQGLQEQLKRKTDELKSLEDAKPKPVEDPAVDPAAAQQAAEQRQRIEELEAELKSLQAADQVARNKKAEATKRSAKVTRALQSVRSYKTAHAQFSSELETQLRDIPLDIDAKDIVSLAVDTTRLEDEIRRLKKEADAADLAMTDPANGTVPKIRLTEEILKGLKSQLDERQRLYLVYREQLAQWERAKADLIGDPTKTDSIKWLEGEIAELEKLPGELSAKRKQRLQLVRTLHQSLQSAANEYRSLYQPVQAFIQQLPQLEMRLPLSFSARLAEDRFQEEFLSRLNRQVRGTFAGVEESNLLLKKMLEETDFSDADKVIEFVERLDAMLHFDQRAEGTPVTPTLVVDQLRKGSTAEELYDLVFGLRYLSPRYSLTYDGQEISMLSPGERGLLLLVFYLLVDKDDIPLVIDQPEENLDNQTIYNVLVSCIKRAKSRRQVIMVTHNPNLAVVCDAEQIIWAECDKAQKRFKYDSGAIETPKIRDRVVEILEGTAPAFLNRQRKYKIGKTGRF